MSEPAVSIAFFDVARRVSATARAGMTLLFERGSVRTLAEGPRVERLGERWHARLDGAFDVELEPIAPVVELDGARTELCHVTGSAGSARVDCLGSATRAVSPPQWAQLDALRSISALFDSDRAIFAVARRPRGVADHGAETVAAAVLVAGEVMGVQDARISTVYDREGRQRSAGLELWLDGEEYPRRASGTAEAGASLELEGLRVQAATFRWHMDAREGGGVYELAVREGA